MPPAPAADFECPSCGTHTRGVFCGACGEKKLGADDRTLRHYFDIVANFLTHFDSKGYRSLWLLVARPGFLSVEQLRGRRVPYAKPLALFLSINVVYYLSIATFGANTFTTPLSVQLQQNDYYAGFAARQVARHVAATHTDMSAFAARYDARTSVLSKTLIFLFIPIYALLFWLFFHRKRRLVVEHAVVATHLWSFILLLLAVAVPVVALLLRTWSHAPTLAAALAQYDNPVSVLLQLCFGTYMALMFRRAYGASMAYCIAVALLLALAFFHIVWLYRFLLFLATLYSL